MTDIPKRDRGRPKGDKPKTDNLIVRSDSDLLSRLDKIVAREREQTGYNISRSDIVRRALVEFIDSQERKP